MDSSKPAKWNPEQMETDDVDGAVSSTTGVNPDVQRWDEGQMAPAPEDGARGQDVQTWNEGQMAPAPEDGARGQDVSEDQIAESRGGLSGGGANPGGGERWADQDVDQAK